MANELNPRLPESEITAQKLFTESLQQGRLPPELTPDIFVEAIDYPNHFTNAADLLRAFGTDPKTTYQTEYLAHHIPAGTHKEVLMTRYEAERKLSTTPKPVQYKLEHSRSARLQILCAAHAPDWTTGQQLYFLMSEKIGPALNYHFNLDPPGNYQQPGDFHLIVDYLKTHFADLQPAYFDLKDISSASAQIGRLRGISLNTNALTELSDSLNRTLGPVNLENSRVKKGKLMDPAPDPFPRAGASSIVRDFERLYVKLNPQDGQAVGRMFGGTDLEPEDVAQFSKHIAHLQMLVLSLFGDKSDGHRPLAQLSTLTHLDLDHTLAGLHYLATLPPSEARDQQAKALDGNTTASLSQTLSSLTEQAMKSPILGFGAARALLVHYTELRLHQDPQADQLEQLMHHLNLLATDPDTTEKVSLDSIFAD